MDDQVRPGTADSLMKQGWLRFRVRCLLGLGRHDVNSHNYVLRLLRSLFQWPISIATLQVGTGAPASMGQMQEIALIRTEREERVR